MAFPSVLISERQCPNLSMACERNENDPIGIKILHLGSGPDNTNNILALAFGVLIVFLVITGSIWIIANLNANMMPM